MISKAITVAVLVFASALALRGSDTPSTPQEAAKIGWTRFQGKPFEVCWVPSSGPIADATFISLSAAKPSSMARDLGKRLAAAAKADVHILIAGPNSAKTRCVAVGALEMQKKNLPKLTLCFLGDADDQNAVTKIAEAQGATVVREDSSK